jgi:hypothetical protein
MDDHCGIGRKESGRSGRGSGSRSMSCRSSVSLRSLQSESITGVKDVLDNLIIRSSPEMKHKQQQPKNHAHKSEKD